MTPEALVMTPQVLPFANNDPLMNAVYQGQYGARLGDDLAWGFDPSTEPQCSSISQDVVIPAGTVNFNFAYAVLASNPGHGYLYDPYFNVMVVDLTDATTLYNVVDYTTSYDPLNPCAPWCLGGWDPNGGSDIVYRRWTTVSLNLSAIAGHTVRLSLTSSDCSPSAHFCEAYLDGAGIACPDTDAPDAVTLQGTCAPGAGDFCAALTWFAPADASSVPDTTGQFCVPMVQAAAYYDIRWSILPILSDADFAAATQVVGEPSPADPGTPESFTLCGLPGGPVYVAMKSLDASFNASAMSTLDLNCISNQPPDCSAGVASPDMLWPPNHQWVPVTIAGLTDPDGDALTITYTSVTQDEPLDTVGDGKFCPDAMIASDGSLLLRAERSGTKKVPGNGRVYVVGYIASDGEGGTCSGTVTVCVPHDMGNGSECIDDGQFVSSLGTCDGDGPNLQLNVVTYETAITGVTRGAQSITLAYTLAAEGEASLALYSAAGRRLSVVDSGLRSAGEHRVTLPTSGIPSGMYYARLTAGKVSVLRPFMVVK